MIISFLRALIIYFLIIVSLRFMGKRQIGELQPTELVVTILISEVAAVPLDDADSPLFATFIPVAVLICLEVIISGISMKSMKFRRILTGKPIIVINDGVIDQKALKSTRISVSDLLDSLRLKGYFDVSKIKFAVIEMNGQISVMPKEENAPLCAENINLNLPKKEIPFTLISTGTIIKNHFKEVGVNEKEIKKRLKKENLTQEQVLLMTCDKNKNYYIVKKDESV